MEQTGEENIYGGTGGLLLAADSACGIRKGKVGQVKEPERSVTGWTRLSDGRKSERH